LIVWVITAPGGFGLLGIWLRRGGPQQSLQPGRRIGTPLIASHLSLAATGLVLWIIYVAGASRGFAWIAFALLLVVATLGFGMLALWLARRQATALERGTRAASVAGEGVMPAEQHFPPALVVARGLIAATTLVLVLLAVLQVGGS
jgi:hypothetical protein